MGTDRASSRKLLSVLKHDRPPEQLFREEKVELDSRMTSEMGCVPDNSATLVSFAGYWILLTEALEAPMQEVAKDCQHHESSRNVGRRSLLTPLRPDINQ